MEFVEDSNGNRCYIAYFGSLENAKFALDSLIDCERCENCSDCARSSDCYYCIDCSDCSDCISCSGCFSCSKCLECIRCTSCIDCSDCFGGTGKEDAGLTTPKIENIDRASYEVCNQPEALDRVGWIGADLKKPDSVNSPEHYTSHPSGIECIQITEHMNFNIGNAVKYLWRADKKTNALEDLKKASWYIKREIERRENVPVAT